MEFFEYEKAFAKYVNTITYPKTPLAAWDFYSSYFTELKKSSSDVALLKNFQLKNKWNRTWNLAHELQNDTVIVLTDTNLKIVFASKNITEMNGYSPNEVIGNHPKMFQGAATDHSVSKNIGEAIKNKVSFDEVVINYCKDGSIYRCEIKGFPIFDRSGKLRNFIAFERMVA